MCRIIQLFVGHHSLDGTALKAWKHKKENKFLHCGTMQSNRMDVIITAFFTRNIHHMFPVGPHRCSCMYTLYMRGQRGGSVLFEQVGDRSVREASRTRGTSAKEFMFKFSL